MSAGIHYIRGELAVDATGDFSSMLAHRLLIELEDFEISAVLPAAEMSIAEATAEVDNRGRGWSRKAALAELESWLTRLVAVEPVGVVVLDDLDSSDSAFLDESLVSYDRTRVLRASSAADRDEVANLVHLLDTGASFRMIAVCLRLSASKIPRGQGVRLSEVEVAQMVAKVDHIILSAFDGEGFVVATRAPAQ